MIDKKHTDGRVFGLWARSECDDCYKIVKAKYCAVMESEEWLSK
jgi:hypothetical protein